MTVLVTNKKVAVTISGPGLPARTVNVARAGLKVVTVGAQGPSSIDAARAAAMQALFNRIYLGGF